LAFWRELHAAGVDLIGSSELTALPRFLRGREVRRHCSRWRHYAVVDA
jgi:hypothetical protein